MMQSIQEVQIEEANKISSQPEKSPEQVTETQAVAQAAAEAKAKENEGKTPEEIAAAEAESTAAPAAEDEAAAAKAKAREGKTPEEIAALDEADKKAVTDAAEKEKEAAREKKQSHDIRRIKSTTRRNAILETENRLYRDMLANQGKIPGGEEQLLKRPARADFQTADEYTEALTDYNEQLLDQTTKASQRREQNTAVSGWEDRVTKSREAHEDYDDVIEDNAELHIPNAAARAIERSAIGPEILYHLGKNPNLVSGWDRMSPEDAVFAVGGIAAVVKAETKTPAKATSKAPAPIKPVIPTSSKANPNLEKETMEEFMARRHKEKLAK